MAVMRRLVEPQAIARRAAESTGTRRCKAQYGTGFLAYVSLLLYRDAATSLAYSRSSMLQLYRSAVCESARTDRPHRWSLLSIRRETCSRLAPCGPAQNTHIAEPEFLPHPRCHVTTRLLPGRPPLICLGPRAMRASPESLDHTSDSR